MGEKTIVSVAYECETGAPKDGFFRVKTLKTLFMLSRVPLDLLKCILTGAINFASVWSSYENSSFFEITRASVLFSRKFKMQFK